jgi:hypothetical protein
MKPRLLDPEGEVPLELELDPIRQALVEDLGLELVFAAMANGDRRVYEVAQAVVLAGSGDPAVIRYRQAVFDDCLADPGMARRLYELAGEAIERERHVFGGLWSQRPDTILHRSVEVISQFVDVLRRLRQLAEERRSVVASQGLRTLFEMLCRELDDAYLATIEEHLRRLRFDDGIVVTAELGPGNRGTNYVLRRRVGRPGWRERLGLADGATYVYEIPDRDEGGFRALAELTGRGVALAAAAVAASADHVLDFFRLLRDEVAFYIGALNLHARLTELGEPVCRAEPAARGSLALWAEGLYDPALALRLDGPVVGNDLAADGARLLVITGANQGGKSTFLRSLGLAQLLMEAGLPVPARSFRAAVTGRVFTHFSREEDETLRRGKLDEELARMRAIVDQVRPGDLVLLNESFSSTNEREGSAIARGVVEALVEGGVRVAYVTHLIDLAEGLVAAGCAGTCFLRAERRPDGTRTFRIVPGAPEGSSHGIDVYRRVFGAAAVEGAPGAVDGPEGGPRGRTREDALV